MFSSYCYCRRITEEGSSRLKPSLNKCLRTTQWKKESWRQWSPMWMYKMRNRENKSRNRAEILFSCKRKFKKMVSPSVQVASICNINWGNLNSLCQATSEKKGIGPLNAKGTHVNVNLAFAALTKNKLFVSKNYILTAGNVCNWPHKHIQLHSFCFGLLKTSLFFLVYIFCKPRTNIGNKAQFFSFNAVQHCKDFKNLVMLCSCC